MSIGTLGRTLIPAYAFFVAGLLSSPVQGPPNVFADCGAGTIFLPGAGTNPLPQKITVSVQELHEKVKQLTEVPAGILDSFYLFHVTAKYDLHHLSREINVRGARWEKHDLAGRVELKGLYELFKAFLPLVMTSSRFEPQVAQMWRNSGLPSEDRLLLLSMIGQLHQNQRAPREAIRRLIKALGYVPVPVGPSQPLRFRDDGTGLEYSLFTGTLIEAKKGDSAAAGEVIQRAAALLPSARTVDWVKAAVDPELSVSVDPDGRVRYEASRVRLSDGSAVLRRSVSIAEGGYVGMVDSRTDARGSSLITAVRLPDTVAPEVENRDPARAKLQQTLAKLQQEVDHRFTPPDSAGIKRSTILTEANLLTSGTFSTQKLENRGIDLKVTANDGATGLYMRGEQQLSGTKNVVSEAGARVKIIHLESDGNAFTLSAGASQLATTHISATAAASDPGLTRTKVDLIALGNSGKVLFGVAGALFHNENAEASNVVVEQAWGKLPAELQGHRYVLYGGIWASQKRDGHKRSGGEQAVAAGAKAGVETEFDGFKVNLAATLSSAGADVGEKLEDGASASGHGRMDFGVKAQVKKQF